MLQVGINVVAKVMDPVVKIGESRVKHMITHLLPVDG